MSAVGIFKLTDGTRSGSSAHAANRRSVASRPRGATPASSSAAAKSARPRSTAKDRRSAPRLRPPCWWPPPAQQPHRSRHAWTTAAALQRQRGARRALGSASPWGHMQNPHMQNPHVHAAQPRGGCRPARASRHVEAAAYAPPLPPGPPAAAGAARARTIWRNGHAGATLLAVVHQAAPGVEHCAAARRAEERRRVALLPCPAAAAPSHRGARPPAPAAAAAQPPLTPCVAPARRAAAVRPPRSRPACSATRFQSQHQPLRPRAPRASPPRRPRCQPTAPRCRANPAHPRWPRARPRAASLQGCCAASPVFLLNRPASATRAAALPDRLRQPHTPRSHRAARHRHPKTQRTGAHLCPHPHTCSTMVPPLTANDARDAVSLPADYHQGQRFHQRRHRYRQAVFEACMAWYAHAAPAQRCNNPASRLSPQPQAHCDRWERYPAALRACPHRFAPPSSWCA